MTWPFMRIAIPTVCGLFSSLSFNPANAFSKEAICFFTDLFSYSLSIERLEFLVLLIAEIVYPLVDLLRWHRGKNRERPQETSFFHFFYDPHAQDAQETESVAHDESRVHDALLRVPCGLSDHLVPNHVEARARELCALGTCLVETTVYRPHSSFCDRSHG